ncbi:hypothetical protein [Rhizobium sp. BK176]|uniref:hypothetical protein n=1 Tax=Rhizobium sp. BK176 TaxID=2587071 RepID=UPI002167853D|nr:hypothetical protein [Rhizobium sp. BK176]MCS4090063.1 hypothetical protein [Rhizobium sp. BK176]
MLSFEDFLSTARRSTSIAAIDREGADVLVYIPVVLFEGGVAISEPLSPRDEESKQDRQETPLSRAQNTFCMEKAFERLQETGDLAEALRGNDWIRGSTVSTAAGRQGSHHSAVGARLIAYLHYLQVVGGPHHVLAHAVVPTLLRLLGVSTQSEVVDFVLSEVGREVGLSTVEDFLKEVREATRPPRWSERKTRKWADVGFMARSFLRTVRERNVEESLVRADAAIADGISPVDAVSLLFPDPHLDGRQAAVMAYETLALLDSDRRHEDWENRLIDEIVARACEIGLSSSVEAGRKLSATLTAASEAGRASMSAVARGRAPLPRGFEEMWTAFGAASLDLPETVRTGDLSLRQLVALEIGELAIADAVSKAVVEFREYAPDVDIGLAQLPYALTYESALDALRDQPVTHLRQQAMPGQR